MMLDEPTKDPLAREPLASALLLAIECRTAHLHAQSRDAMAWYLTGRAIEEREQAFLEAMAGGCDLPHPPTIQELERYASCWADLVSEADAGLRAALAHALGQRYVLARKAVPGIWAALGLDEMAVQQAYQQRYGEPLASLSQTKGPVRDRLRWTISELADRLESLPPFWLTFALTLPGAAGLLALPIALGRLGLGAGIVLVLAFGLLNLLTVVAQAEAVARTGTGRFGLGFLGQLMHEYLGPSGGVFLTVTMALNNFFVLIIFYIGVGGTLEDATGLPSELWIGALFLVCLYFLSRKTLNAAVGTTLAIVLVNVLILLAIPMLALPHFRATNLAASDPASLGGRLLDPGAWELILGVLLSTFFSHYLVPTYAPVVLRRDPGARSWIPGSAAAILAITGIACLWLVVVKGVVPREALVSTTSTVLSPLADRVGPVIHVLGSVLVILSLGLTSVQIALGLFFLVQERRPAIARLGRDRRVARIWFWLAAGPVVVVFLLSEWVAVTGAGTFAGLLGFASALALPLLSGIFPVLLLATTRCKGDFVPSLVLRPLGHPVVLAALYLVFLGSVFAYGLFIYQRPAQRAVTVLVGLVVLVMTGVLLRRGALDKRAVVELRRDLTPGGENVFGIVSAGRPTPADVHLRYPDGEERRQTAGGEIPACAVLQSAAFALPTTGASTLKVWAHEITPERVSRALPAQLTVGCGDKVREFDRLPAGGQIVLPLEGEPCRVEIHLRPENGPGVSAAR